ncbi:MAG: phosphatase PAP2 family protein [Burkholderiaceae bacterium]
MRAVELAEHIGANPLISFLTALLLLLFVVVVFWFTLHRFYIRRHRLPDAAAARSFTATVALGFASIAAAAALFALLPGAIANEGWLSSADQALTDALRKSVSLPVLQSFAAVTFLADTATLWAIAAAVALALLWRRQWMFALAWTIALAGNGILTRVLKAIFARTRPSFEHELFSVQGWSFPSGHSSGAVVAYGMLAYIVIRFAPKAWHLWIVLAATALAFTIGCSRIFLQVHYASDVLAGFASGAAWLAVCIVAAETIRARRAKHAQISEL